MALGEFAKDLGYLSRNAAKLAKKLGELEGNTEMLRGIVASRISDEAIGILLEELRKAIIDSKEYNDPLFAGPLERVFSNPAMIRVTRSGVSIMPQAMILAGTWGELQYGVDAAKAMLGLGRLGRAEALEFWKHRIYRPARENLKIPRRFKKNLGFYKGAKKGERKPFDYQRYGLEKYSMTLEARKSSWGTKAPYWLWLNFGNEGSGGKAYPPVKPTHFIAHAERRITSLVEQRIIEITNEFTDAISEEVVSFLRNPQAYQPGQVLDRFMIGGAEFTIGVTPTRELGVRRIG